MYFINKTKLLYMARGLWLEVCGHLEPWTILVNPSIQIYDYFYSHATIFQ